jgi:hypothetical protein
VRRNLKKHVMIVPLPTVLLMVVLAMPLSAQSVFVSRVTGGTQREQSYFMSAVSEELTQIGYKLVKTIDRSDYYMTIVVEGDDGFQAVTFALYNTKTENLIASSMMGYEALEEMDKWNSYMVNEVMADAPSSGGTSTKSRSAATNSTKRTSTDFSFGRRVASAAMNPLLGLGSYTMGDLGGGVIITTGYAIAAGFILWEASEKMGEDWGLHYDTKWKDTSIAGIPFIVGLGVAGVTTVFGFIRPFFYHRPDENSKVAAAFDGIRFAVIPDTSGIKAVHLGYNFQL